MVSLKEAAAEFLVNKRVAVSGVLPSARGHGANAVYRRLRERGYQVFAVNAGETQAEGDPCYNALGDIPGGVEAVVIAGPAAATENTMRECAELGIEHVWVHRAGGADSACTAATVYGRSRGISVIDGGCPLMFAPVTDVEHQLMRFMMAASGKRPTTA